MQNKFSRDYVEQKDKEKELDKKEWRLKMMNPPPPPKHRVIKQFSVSKLQSALLIASIASFFLSLIAFKLYQVYSHH